MARYALIQKKTDVFIGETYTVSVRHYRWKWLAHISRFFIDGANRQIINHFFYFYTDIEKIDNQKGE